MLCNLIAGGIIPVVVGWNPRERLHAKVHGACVITNNIHAGANMILIVL